MAFALPVAALAQGGIGEAVEDGVNGLLTQEATPAAMATTVRLLSDAELGRRLGEAARETVRAHFSADRMVEETLRLFEKLAGERGTAGKANAGSPSARDGRRLR
jgi:glycosyltransferase involved in cell wall biosynthesis